MNLFAIAMAVFVEKISSEKGKGILVAKTLFVEGLKKKTMFEKIEGVLAFFEVANALFVKMVAKRFLSLI